jgi:hypothetical protein
VRSLSLMVKVVAPVNSRAFPRLRVGAVLNPPCNRCPGPLPWNSIVVGSTTVSTNVPQNVIPLAVLKQ